jgi:hypothetical protein
VRGHQCFLTSSTEASDSLASCSATDPRMSSGEAALPVAADDDQVAAQFVRLVDQHFRYPALPGFEEDGFSLDAAGLGKGVLEDLLACTAHGAHRMIEVMGCAELKMMHAEQDFVGDMDDIEAGIADAGYIDRFVERATRGFAVVYGDDDLLVHGCLSLGSVSGQGEP